VLIWALLYPAFRRSMIGQAKFAGLLDNLGVTGCNDAPG
jgi:hypothetical protein